MARPPQDVPKMCRHKASDQAVARLGDKDHYLGRWGSAKAKAAYHRLIAEWLAQGDRVAGGPPLETVAELAAAYLAYAHNYYRKNGRPTSELSVVEAVWRYALTLYADISLEEFGPLALRAVRDSMIRAGLARRTINAQIHRLRRAWRWAAENKPIDAELWHRLAAVPGLRPGRGGCCRTWGNATATQPPRPPRSCSPSAVQDVSLPSSLLLQVGNVFPFDLLRRSAAKERNAKHRGGRRAAHQAIEPVVIGSRREPTWAHRPCGSRCRPMRTAKHRDTCRDSSPVESPATSALCPRESRLLNRAGITQLDRYLEAA